MRRRHLLIAILVLARALAGVTPAVAQEIGRIQTLNGAAIIQRGTAELQATVGAILHSGDVILTGPDGIMGILCFDRTTMALGPKTRLKLIRFQAPSPGDHAPSQAELTKGKVVVNSEKSAVAVKTPASVIQAAKTRFAVEVQ